MRTRTILAAAAFAVAIIVPAQANAATLRVVSPTKTLYGATETQVGSTRAYLDSKGTSHALKANTALGQLVAAAGWTGTSIVAGYSAGLGAYVTKIAGVAAPKSGYWALFVNGLPAAVGADSQVLTKSDRVIWIGDNDYSVQNGPFVYDLTATKNTDGTVTFTGMKVGGRKPLPAAGLALSVTGVLGATLNARGQTTLTVPEHWTASIGSTGSISGSEILNG